MMDDRKEPLVSPSDEWVRDYHSNVEQPRHHHHRTVRRRKHRRFVSREFTARRRIVRLALVCSVALIVMAATLYMVLNRQESTGESSSQYTPARAAGERLG